MKSSSILASIVRCGVALWLTQAGLAGAVEIKVLSTIGVRPVLQEVRPQFERATGHTLAISFDVANALKRRIDAGESFDVAILTVPVIEELIKQGKIVGDTKVVIARGGMGMAVRAGAPKPDISSTEAFKNTLLQVKSVSYPKEGMTGIHMGKVMERLGITQAMEPKLSLTTGSGNPAEMVARGEVEIAAHLIPELLAVQGLSFLGPLPAEVQTYIVLPGGVSTSATQAQAGRDLLKFLTGPSVLPIIKAKGYEPG